jgi:vacuolar-type H+-ATPase subunit I/STV1
MTTSTAEFILRARQLDLQAMQNLAVRATLVEVIGKLVHALQWERGVTSIFLTSGGKSFAQEKTQAVQLSEHAEQALRAQFATQLHATSGVTSSMMSTMGWVLLDLGRLEALRAAIEQQATRTLDAVGAFSRVIAGLIELVFQLADGANDPSISRLLVALVHLFQVKEAAGQERAVGAHLLASGQCAAAEQQRFIHLIEAQERAAGVLLEFMDDDLQHHWHHAHNSANMAQLERLRRGLCMAKANAKLDESQSTVWFQVSSLRIDQLVGLEAALLERLRANCTKCIATAEKDLEDSTGLVRRLHQNPSAHAQAVDRYYSEAGQPEHVPVLTTRAEHPLADEDALPADVTSVVTSLQELLQQQSTKLTQTEQELRKAKQALNERKTIERAKGALMSRLGMTEDAAYRALQKAAMDHNKRLLDVAEATLALSDIALGSSKH